jgi:hypothetical protein
MLCWNVLITIPWIIYDCFHREFFLLRRAFIFNSSWMLRSIWTRPWHLTRTTCSIVLVYRVWCQLFFPHFLRHFPRVHWFSYFQIYSRTWAKKRNWKFKNLTENNLSLILSVHVPAPRTSIGNVKRLHQEWRIHQSQRCSTCKNTGASHTPWHVRAEMRTRNREHGLTPLLLYLTLTVPLGPLPFVRTV